MFCPKCGTEIPDTSVFCRSCGIKIQPEFEEQKKTSPHWKKPLLVLTGVVVAVFCLRALTVSTYRPPINNFANQPIGTPQWVHQTSPAKKEFLTVQPGAIIWQPFTVPTQWRNVHLKSEFRAKGGSGNDIIVYLVDDEGLENLKNGHRFMQYYESGQVTVGHFDKSLSPGKYNLVFSNRMSIFSNKVVEYEMIFDFDMLQN